MVGRNSETKRGMDFWKVGAGVSVDLGNVDGVCGPVAVLLSRAFQKPQAARPNFHTTPSPLFRLEDFSSVSFR